MKNIKYLLSISLNLLHTSIALIVCIVTSLVICGWTKNNFLDIKRSLSIQIRSAKRTGQGGHSMIVEVLFKNKGKETIVVDCDALSLEVSPQKESGGYGPSYMAYHLKLDVPRSSGGFYDSSMQRYICLYPDEKIKQTFVARYIGDKDIHARLRHSLNDPQRDEWAQCKAENVRLVIRYHVTDSSLYDTFDSDFTTFVCKDVCSRPYDMNLQNTETISPPLSFHLLDARMVTFEDMPGATDQIEYTVRIESTTNEIVSIDTRNFSLYVSWDDKEDMFQYEATGLSFVPPLKPRETQDPKYLLSIPPKGARILTQRTQYIGSSSMHSIFPESYPFRDLSDDNWEYQYWINRVAEKYRICIGYHAAHIRFHPTLLCRGDIAQKSDYTMYTEERETTLGQTRFAGEAWFQEVGVIEEK